MLTSQITDHLPCDSPSSSHKRRQPEVKVHSLNPRHHIDFGNSRTFANRELVYRQGDPSTHVFQIEDGVIMLYSLLPDGRRQVIDFAFPGDFIGLGTTGEYAFSAEAMAPVKVRCITAKMLEDVAHRDPDIALALYKAVTQELSSARALLVAIGQRSAVERVAAFIVSLYQRQIQCNGQPNSPSVNLPMRRADIADLLGLTIETVSRNMTKLRVMGMIDIKHATIIEIKDLARLENLAETD